MAKTKKGEEHQPQSNGPTPEQTAEVIQGIEGEHEGLLKLKMAYMASCKPYHERIKGTIEAAVSTYGMSKRAIKAKINERSHLRKADAERDKLDEEELEAYDRLSEQLGPLGMVARERYQQGDPLSDFAR